MAYKDALLADPMGDALTSPTGSEITQFLKEISANGDQAFHCHMLRTETTLVVSAGNSDIPPSLTLTLTGHNTPFATLTFESGTSTPIVRVGEGVSWPTLGYAIGSVDRWPSALAGFNDMLIQTANSQINVIALQELGIRK